MHRLSLDLYVDPYLALMRQQTAYADLWLVLAMLLLAVASWMLGVISVPDLPAVPDLLRLTGLAPEALPLA